MWISPVLLPWKEPGWTNLGFVGSSPPRDGASWGTPKRSVGIGPRNEKNHFFSEKTPHFWGDWWTSNSWISWCFRPRLPTCFHVLPILVDQTWKRIVETWNIIFLAKHIPNVSQLCATYAIESLLQGLVEVMDLCVALLKQTRKSSE